MTSSNSKLCAGFFISTIVAAAVPQSVNAATRSISAGLTTGGAGIAYVVSQHSPLLSAAEKSAISQGFNGVPLSGKPKMHTVTANSLTCRGPDAAPVCVMDFGAGKTASVQGDEAKTLFAAMGKAGTGGPERSLSNLSCTVDDAKAQNTPSSGDDVAGFVCMATTNMSAPKAAAALQKGEMIYPDYPGASQSCVMAHGNKWSEDTPLVVAPCPVDKSANRFVRVGKEIQVYQAPGLCVGLDVGAHRSIVKLEKCDGAARKWASPATGIASALVRSNMNECWTVPTIETARAAEVEAWPCDDKGGKPIKFFFEK